MNQHQSGREDTFNALYDADYAAVWAYAWRRDPGSADDVVAETFLVAWRRLEDIPTRKELPWLLGVARNAMANIRRGERRRRTGSS
jgi:DNA-directed RNA polymerase specialized sigma24 family protein